MRSFGFIVAETVDIAKQVIIHIKSSEMKIFNFVM